MSSFLVPKSQVTNGYISLGVVCTIHEGGIVYMYTACVCVRVCVCVCVCVLVCACHSSSQRGKAGGEPSFFPQRHFNVANVLTENHRNGLKF